MFAGLTAANVLGVPFGTFLGQEFGWRSTFWAITAIGVVALVGIATLVPASAATARAPSLRRELTAFRSGQVWLSLPVTVLGFGGMFGAFTYIAYTLTEVSGFDSGAVPWLLMLFGAGLVRRQLDRRHASPTARSTRTLLGFIAALVVVLALFAWLAWSQVVTVVLALLDGRLRLRHRPRASRAASCGTPRRCPTLASGANIAAFNLGNALGAFAGGLAITAGLGYTSPIWVGALITAGGASSS